jgi:undecaprenyl-diphosphatase
MKIVRNIIQQILSLMPEWMRTRYEQAKRTNLLPLLLTIRVGGLIFAALAMWAFAQIADEVLDKETQTIDTAILQVLRGLRTPLLDQVMMGVTFLGEPTVLLLMCLSLGIWLLIRKRREEATTIAIAAGGAGGLNYLIKDLFRRQRPPVWERIVDVNHYSFPSGHAMVSLVVYGIIGYLLVTHFPRWRSLIISLTIILVSAIGFSRLYLSVHWPTDVIAGYAAGVVWLIACIVSMEIWHEYRSAKSRKEDKSMMPE